MIVDILLVLLIGGLLGHFTGKALHRELNDTTKPNEENDHD